MKCSINRWPSLSKGVETRGPKNDFALSPRPNGERVGGGREIGKLAFGCPLYRWVEDEDDDEGEDEDEDEDERTEGEIHHATS